MRTLKVSRRIIRRSIIICLLLIGIILLLPSAASATTFLTQKIVVTDTEFVMETTPVLGRDDVSRIVVFTSQTFNTELGIWEPGVIYAQRLSTDAAIPPRMTVAAGATDNQLPDISGTMVVYTAFTDASTLQGQIQLINLNDGHIPFVLSDQAMVREARIDGDLVVWIEFFNGIPRVMLKDVGTAAAPMLISDTSTQPARSLQIGDILVVWEVDYNIVAYDLRSNQYHWVANTSERERYPSTSGSWVVWEEQISGLETKILAVDVDSGDSPIIVADTLTVNHAPTISGDIITYESLVEVGPGEYDFDIFLYQISTGLTFTVTDSPGDQKLNNVFGDQVAYIDNSGGVSNDVSVMTFWLKNPPVADAGPDGSIHSGESYILDGSASSDPDGDLPLVYDWTLASSPVGSSTGLEVGADPAHPILLPDIPGDYVIELIVTDSTNSVSDTDAVVITAWNTEPISDAGPDQAVILLGSTIQLDGTQSYDDDGDPIQFQWNVITLPVGSTASLDDPTSSAPSFVADLNGTYEFELQVSDAWSSSTPDHVIVSFENVQPVSDAGQNQAVSEGDTVQLDGTGSTDDNGDLLTYSWSMLTIPDGSASALDDPFASQTNFIADTVGTYEIQLVVNDGSLNSEPSIVTIVATTTQCEIVQLLNSIIVKINELDPTVFKNKNMQNVLTSKINTILTHNVSCEFQEELNRLEHDMLCKTDGCAETGSPDRNDWIQNCESQNLIYPYLMEVIDLIRALP